MTRLLLMLAWIDLILGIIGSVYFLMTGGLKDTNLPLMISGGFLVGSVFTYLFYLCMRIFDRQEAR